MSRIQEIAAQISQQSTPPVHLWKPAEVGEIDIFINAQGEWFHEGDLIERDQLVRLFASILWFEKNSYYLVTPVEKLKIQVADVPFLVHQAEQVERSWAVVTNVHQQIIISEQNPVALRMYEGQALPYINVRYDLWARVNRSIYFQWVTLAMDSPQESDNVLRLSSDDYAFDVASC